MREPIKDRVRLEHIVEAADNISRYTSGKTYDDLLADDMMCYVQTASRMKKDGIPTKQISRYTGLTAEEIERL